MARSKIKVLSTTSSEWSQVVQHARQLGAYSRDNQYGFNREKTALTIAPDNRMLYSTPDMKPASGPKPVKVSVREFLNFTTLDDVDNNATAKACSAEVANAVGATVSGAISAMQDIVQDIRDASPCSQDTLVVKSAKVLVQNVLLWRTIGLSKLEALGLDITRDGDKAYVLDIASNTAEELTPEYASTQAEKDLVNGDVTPFTIFAKDCELVEELVMVKRVEE